MKYVEMIEMSMFGKACLLTYNRLLKKGYDRNSLITDVKTDWEYVAISTALLQNCFEYMDDIYMILVQEVSYLMGIKNNFCVNETDVDLNINQLLGEAADSKLNDDLYLCNIKISQGKNYIYPFLYSLPEEGEHRFAVIKTDMERCCDKEIVLAKIRSSLSTGYIFNVANVNCYKYRKIEGRFQGRVETRCFENTNIELPYKLALRIEKDAEKIYNSLADKKKDMNHTRYDEMIYIKLK